MNVSHAYMKDVAPAADASTLRWRLGVLAFLTSAGDFLLFRRSLGLSIFLFAGIVEIGAVMAAGADRRKTIICAIVGSGTLAPVIDDVNVLSLAIALCGAAAVALIANGALCGSLVERALQVLRFLASGPFQALLDIPEVGPNLTTSGINGRALVAWVLPVGLGGVFLALFSAANPIVEAWLTDIDFRPLLALLDVWRFAFWIALAALVWPFLSFRTPNWRTAFRSLPKPESIRHEFRAPTFLSIAFGQPAIFRSLILFNAMFAIQTALDVAILWGGHSLPAGVSFAGYAHRGAYPLVATALLAGAFVILAMRPGTTASRSKSIRALVYLWTGQNVALVLSSLYRLDLYVQAYSLTYWRVAAFMWMGLVAVGLTLIIFQLATRRSNRWLLSSNAFAVATTLYLCAFVNFDYLIADYNIHHCAEVSSESVELDINYMQSLGPDAIPAVDAALAMPGSPFASSGRLNSVRSTLDSMQQSRPEDWRSWTFRKWRLARYLEADTETPTKR